MSAKKTSVMLAGGWPGPFRRTVKSDKGESRVLTFEPGQVVELSSEELEAVRDDVGKSLHIAAYEKDAKPVAKPDRKATEAFVEETAKMREKEAAKDEAAADTSTAKPASARKDIEKKDK